jgi:hypothetical protein
VFADRAQHARLPPETPGGTWIRCWKPVWVKMFWFWQPGIVKLQVRTGPAQPWIMRVEHAGARDNDQVGCVSTIYYDPRFVRPLDLPAPPEPPDEPDF